MRLFNYLLWIIIPVFIIALFLSMWNAPLWAFIIAGGFWGSFAQYTYKMAFGKYPFDY